jgi:hypothetical protein
MKSNLTKNLILAGVIAIAVGSAIVSVNSESHKRNRVCEGRDGLKVADRVPTGKSRMRRFVITTEGERIPYREWISTCTPVRLPGEEP